ncbi:MAG: deoxyguanosinetriphosphate triphosphohydrolase [Anaerolineales bacterium]|jgi:dGTPase
MFITRQAMEAGEVERLAPYACLSAMSRGREYPENEAAYRTAFQRDRDRILHTTAFRRLEHKTQVFIIYEGDYYRTRLTHTLEVAQIGRSIARALGANEDLVEAICLAHDLGHPPFGHSGEVALARIMKDYGGFDHNKQSLRIVTQLERRYPEFPGLNLTWETREGIVKHETEYDIADAASYDPSLRGHLEAQITNLADELAYTTHDLDDGLRSEMIRSEDLEQLAIWQSLRESIGWHTGPLEELTRHQLIRRFIGRSVTDVVESTERRIARSGVTTREELQQLAFNVIGFGEELDASMKQLKPFLYAHMYRHFRVVRMAVKAERFLSDLFAAYVEAPEILPPSVQVRATSADFRRVVCDYIAGMTDRFALEEHQKLFDPYTKP